MDFTLSNNAKKPLLLYNSNPKFVQHQNFFLKKINNTHINLSNTQSLLLKVNSPIQLKLNIFLFTKNLSNAHIFMQRFIFLKFFLPFNLITNLIPHTSFNKTLSKNVLNSFTNKLFDDFVVPWYYHSFIRFIENCSGRKVIFQFFPFVNQVIKVDDIMRYKVWLPRMSFYERKLGHRFFLEEALHLMHLSFILHDPKIFTS